VAQRISERSFRELQRSRYRGGLPRNISTRLGIAFFAAPLGIFSAFTLLAVLLQPKPPPGVFFAAVFLALAELMLAATVVSALAFLWAIATPRWVERVFEAAWKKLLFAILVSLIPAAMLMAMVALNMKL